MTKEKESKAFQYACSMFPGKARVCNNEMNPVVKCVFALVNRFVLLARSITIFVLTLGGVVLSPVLSPRHHDEVFSLLYKQSDKLYTKALRDKKNIRAKSVTDLKEAGKKLKKLVNAGSTLASHADTLYQYIESKKDKWEALHLHMSILGHVPVVGDAFAALLPVLEVLKSDAELKDVIESTAENIGELVKELKKTTNRIEKANQLHAFEMEKFNTLFQMIEDGCYRLRRVLEDRGDSAWKRFSMSGAHRESLDSWNEVVKKMKVKESETKVNIIFYQTKYISELAKSNLKFILVDVTLSIVALVFLWIIHGNVLQILRRLDPLHVKIFRMVQGFWKRIPAGKEF